jgi:spore germination cell wall hydrolase CwlJ-like protein|tara:strand:- start:43 stop:642 length:600 start_codon:yes stop_codon:yes gene_type:complete
MKLKHIGIMALNAIICAGIGYAAYEGHKRNSESAEAIEIRATELAEELAEAEAEKTRVKAERIEQLTCLATNIYYETMAVSLVDAMAVTDVVLNRVDHKKYPTTPCEVVHQSYLNDKGDPLLNKCQFSWYCDGKADEPQNAEAWEKSVRYAADIYHKGNWRGITEGSTHYHATYVSPKWAKSFTKIAQIGAHIFYRQEN